jgi:hypothetical protein
MDLTEVEAQRRRDSTEQLIGEMRAGGDQYRWWNRVYEELDGRTPTEALAAGDEQQVRDLIDRWYEQTEATVERLKNDPEFVATIERQAAELHAPHHAA